MPTPLAMKPPVTSHVDPQLPYPPTWERVAELRVFRAPPHHWEKLLRWRSDMHRRGWRLLQVFTEPADIVAVFGRTKPELLDKERS
jgi:hypothetical protein